jgi:hypothetical protein
MNALMDDTKGGVDTKFHISTVWIDGSTLCYWRVLSGLEVAPGGSISSSGRQARTLKATEFNSTGRGS